MSPNPAPLGGGTGSDSTFSRIVDGKLPADWIENDPASPVVCFRNRLKWERVMLLVVPREYMTQHTMWQGDVVQDALRLAVRVGEESCPEGFRVLSNFGRAAHQSQLHAHLHVVSGTASNIEASRPLEEWRRTGIVFTRREAVESIPHADRYRDDLSSSQFEFLTGEGAPAAASMAIEHAASFSKPGFRLLANYRVNRSDGDSPRGGEPGLYLFGGGQLDLYV